MSSLNKMLSSTHSSTGYPTSRAPSRRASIINFFKHRKSKDHSQGSTELLQALENPAAHSSQQRTQPHPRRLRRHHSEAPALDNNLTLDVHPLPLRTKHQPPPRPPPPPQQQQQQPCHANPSDTELDPSTNPAAPRSSPKATTTVTTAATTTGISSANPSNPSNPSNPNNPSLVSAALSLSLPRPRPPPPPTTLPSHPSPPTPPARTTSSRAFNPRASLRAVLGRFSWSGVLSEEGEGGGGKGVGTGTKWGGSQDGGGSSSWGSWSRHGKKKGEEGKEKRKRLRKGGRKGGGGGGKEDQGGGGGEPEDREAAERRKRDEIRAFKANEAARIIRASCMAGLRIRKRKQVAMRILEHVSVNEREGRAMDGSAAAGRGRAYRAEQVRKLARWGVMGGRRAGAGGKRIAVFGLNSSQNRSLRIVVGAYKSAPIRCLETEAWVPPLDLYLNKRLADFEGRLQKQALQSGAGPEAERITTGHLITEACNKVYRRFNKRRKTRGRRPRQGPQSPTPTELAASVVAQWVNYKWKIGGKDRGSNTKEVVELAWQARWEQQRAGQQSTTRQRVLNRRIADEDPPALLFTDKALMRHEGLTKAQSSLLSQARIGDIGLRDYLFRVKVPEVRTPYCECGRGRETVEHLVVWCPDPPLQRPWDGREIRSHRDLQTVLRGVGARSRRFVRKVLGWLMDSGRLLEYRLARRLELETVDGEG
ncbi:predicted protein [Chaetomium globosum CBS 148.51]|uniref:Uncharacterized protein n=1 Tax=Chaetomium globosum (strain ATCC 6205 / CBS 148.51 / DSM 1962 / NBRC 6347 / NRRL 1970) TaxID=306901 RepID=Q2GXJ8_CHAGB|nr:uncharacterized protein CHGG_07306 [Chaetomium globosum CBS 148.51]EAQ86053.1 predicted protein [Chaetomium globosum CBS 148.51]